MFVDQVLAQKSHITQIAVAVLLSFFEIKYQNRQSDCATQARSEASRQWIRLFLTHMLRACGAEILLIRRPTMEGQKRRGLSALGAGGPAHLAPELPSALIADRLPDSLLQCK